MTTEQETASRHGTKAGDAHADFARLGEEFHLRGETEASLHLLAEGLRRRPGNVTGRLVLARVCRESGRPEEARDWLESALRADPDCPAALLQLAELSESRHAHRHRATLCAQEPWENAYRLYPAAAAEDGAASAPDPQDIPATQSWAASSGIGEEEEPENEDPANLPHVATVTLAEIYFQQGLKEQAAQIYRQLVEQRPGDASAKKRLEEIETSIAGPDPRATDGNG